MSETKHSKGGIARAAKLSPARRREIATQAAQTRWGTGSGSTAPKLRRLSRFDRGIVCAATFIASTERDDQLVKPLLDMAGIRSMEDLQGCDADDFDKGWCRIAFEGYKPGENYP